MKISLKKTISVNEILISLLIFTTIFYGFITNLFINTSYFMGTILTDALYILIILTSIYELIKIPQLKVDSQFKTCIFIYIIIAFIYSLLAMVGNNSFNERFFGTRDIVVYSSIFLLTVIINIRENSIKRLFNLIKILGLSLCMFGIFQFFFYSHLPEWLQVLRNENYLVFYIPQFNSIRVNALCSNPIVFSGFALIIFAITFYELLNKPSIKNSIYVLIASMAIIVTFSRAAIVGIVLTAFIQLVISKVNKKIIIATIIAMILFIILFYFLERAELSSFIIQRLLNQDFATQNSTYMHANEREYVINLLNDNIFYGQGAGYQKYLTMSDGRILTDGHWYIFILWYGLVNTLIYFFYCLACLFSCFKCIKNNDPDVRKWSIILFSLSTYFIIAGFLNSSFIARNNYILYWLMIGLLAKKVNYSNLTGLIRENLE